MGPDGVLPRGLLSAAVRALEPRSGRPGPGGAGRSAQQPLLLLLHRAVAAGSLLFYRAVDRRRPDPVPDEFGGRPHLVRLPLPANRVDGSVLRRRALGRGRSPRAHAQGRRARHHEAAALRRDHAEALDLADDRLVDRRRLGSLFQRCADAGEAARHLRGADAGLYLDRDPDRHDLRAGRLHARAGLRLHVPVAADPGRADRRMGAQRHLQIRSRREAHVAEEGERIAGVGRSRR